MFKKNDKYLVRAHKLLKFFTIFFAVVGVIAGIVLSALELIEIGLPILFCVPFICWCIWSGIMLHLSYLCDVKLIRNKLYNVNNDYLDDFIKQNESANEYAQPMQSSAASQNPIQDNTDALLKLRKLYNSGALTEEEYNKEKANLLK